MRGKGKESGNFARACRKATVRQLTQRSTFGDDSGISSRYSESEHSVRHVNQDKNASWKVNVTAENVQIQFRVDTGADLTVISEEYNKSLKGKVGLRKTEKKLFGPGKFTLRVIGEFEACLKWIGKISHKEIFCRDWGNENRTL